MCCNRRKKKEAKNEIAEMNFWGTVADYTRKDQTRNTKIKEDLNVSNLSDNIPKSSSQGDYYM
jgi:hypothetical protein